ncbi:MAG: hypothetical protein WD645_01110 [Dehalococcoidia bacterium]
MIDYKQLCEELEAGEHFTLARFNDGEMMAVQSAQGVVARGDQPVVPSLSRGLRSVLEKGHGPGFYLGHPCARCFPRLRQLYHEYVPENRAGQTQATVLINNGRWFKSFEAICRAAESRPVYWVGQPEHDLSCFEHRNISLVKYELPAQDAWGWRGEVENLTFPDHSLVLLSCGPLSRWLAWKYHERHSGQLTVLDIGSLLDPLTRGVWHPCHTYGEHSCHCAECDHSLDDERLKRPRDEIRQIAGSHAPNPDATRNRLAADGGMRSPEGIELTARNMKNCERHASPEKRQQARDARASDMNAPSQRDFDPQRTYANVRAAGVATVAVTPLLGEFGFLLFDVQPRVRAWLRAQEAQRKVVIAPRAWHCLFEEATELIEPPQDLLPEAPAEYRSIDHRHWSKGDPQRNRIEALVEWARQQVPAERWLEIPYFSAERWSIEPAYTRLIVARPVPADKYVVVHARTRRFGARKNWPTQRWDELVARIRDTWGCRVVAIGSPEAA